MMKQKQSEICPWCKKRIYVAPANSQPCPKCNQLINVYQDGPLVRDAPRILELVLGQARDELSDLQLAIAGNLRVSPKTLKNSQARVRRLQEELRSIKQKPTKYERS